MPLPARRIRRGGALQRARKDGPGRSAPPPSATAERAWSDTAPTRSRAAAPLRLPTDPREGETRIQAADTIPAERTSSVHRSTRVRKSSGSGADEAEMDG